MIEIKCSEAEREQLLNTMNVKCPLDNHGCIKYDSCDTCLDEEIDWNITDANEEYDDKYSILIEELLSRGVTVSAKSERDALNKVRYMYNHEEIVLDTDDFCGVTFKNI